MIWRGYGEREGGGRWKEGMGGRGGESGERDGRGNEKEKVRERERERVRGEEETAKICTCTFAKLVPISTSPAHVYIA